MKERTAVVQDSRGQSRVSPLFFLMVGRLTYCAAQQLNYSDDMSKGHLQAPVGCISLIEISISCVSY